MISYCVSYIIQITIKKYGNLKGEIPNTILENFKKIINRYWQYASKYNLVLYQTIRMKCIPGISF